MSDFEFIKKLYIDEKQSTYQIAKAINKSPSAVKRLLQKYNIPIRSRSESQKITIENQIKNGTHPTLGKTRSEKDKEKIGKALIQYWEDNQEAKHKMAKHANKTLKKRKIREKIESSKKAHEEIRNASKNGSKLEHFIKDYLSSRGLTVYPHKNMLENERLEVDMYVADYKTVIEVDGPSHFKPIWGQDKLEKQQKADREKIGLLLSKGLLYIRVKNLCRYSVTRYKIVSEKVYNTLIDPKFHNGSEMVELEA